MRSDVYMKKDNIASYCFPYLEYTLKYVFSQVSCVIIQMEILGMDIEILQTEFGAKLAKGTTIIIDVFRAFSLEAYLFQNGCKEVKAVYDKELAYQLKKEHPDYILIGERHGKILPGFDYGNAPSVIEKIDFTDKTVIHTTSNGTLGIQNAKNADDMYVASFVNAKATVEAIQKKHPGHISIVCMGWEGKETEEDTLCALYLKALFENQPMDNIETLLVNLKKTEGKKFFDPKQQDVFPQRDFFLCIDLNKFDFAIHTEIIDGIASNRKESVYE